MIQDYSQRVINHEKFYRQTMVEMWCHSVCSWVQIRGWLVSLVATCWWQSLVPFKCILRLTVKYARWACFLYAQQYFWLCAGTRAVIKFKRVNMLPNNKSILSFCLTLISQDGYILTECSTWKEHFSHVKQAIQAVPAIDLLHLTAYLAALPTNPPECSHRVWSRNGREGRSGMLYDVITQMVHCSFMQLAIIRHARAVVAPRKDRKLALPLHMVWAGERTAREPKPFDSLSDKLGRSTC